MNTTDLPFSSQKLRRFPFFSHQFAVVGGAASGKTVLSDNLAKAFPAKRIEHLSAGGIMRELAKQAGSSISDFAQFLAKNPTGGQDEFVDARVREHMSRNRRSVDAHLPIFSPRAFIVKLACPWKTCAERRAAQRGRPVAEVYEELVARDKADRRRYNELYPGSGWLDSEFDFVVDTDHNDAYKTFKLVLGAHSLWLECWKNSIVSDDRMAGQSAVV